MEKELSIDIWQGGVAKFLTLRQVWILRFVSREWHKAFNEALFRIFKQRYEALHLKPAGLSVQDMNAMLPGAKWCFTGSTVASTLLDEKWKKQDLDVFVEGGGASMLRTLDPSILSIKNRYSDPEYCPDLSEILKCLTVRANEVPVDVCFRLDSVDEIEDLVEVFDLTCCMNVYDGKTLWIYNPTLLFHKRMVKVKKNPKTGARIRKYIDRGFWEYYDRGYISTLFELCRAVPFVL
jgi:hypothetical protein